MGTTTFAVEGVTITLHDETFADVLTLDVIRYFLNLQDEPSFIERNKKMVFADLITRTDAVEGLDWSLPSLESREDVLAAYDTFWDAVPVAVGKEWQRRIKQKDTPKNDPALLPRSKMDPSELNDPQPASVAVTTSNGSSTGRGGAQNRHAQNPSRRKK